MDPAAPPPVRDRRLREISSAQAVRRRGVDRRSVLWTTRQTGTEAPVAEMRRRRSRMLAAGGAYLIICDRGAIRLLC